MGGRRLRCRFDTVVFVLAAQLHAQRSPADPWRAVRERPVVMHRVVAL